MPRPVASPSPPLLCPLPVQCADAATSRSLLPLPLAQRRRTWMRYLAMPVPAAADHDRGAVMANEFGAPIGPGSKHRLEAAAIVISVGKYGLPVVFQYLAAIVEYLAIVLTTTGMRWEIDKIYCAKSMCN